MPSFYNQPVMGQLPHTPPYAGSFEGQACPPGHYQNAYAAQQHAPQRMDSVVDYSQRYSAPQPPPPSTQQNGYNPATSFDHNLPSIHSYYEPIGAPLLPPLRMQTAYPIDHRSFYGHVSQQPAAQPQQAPQHPTKKEEQATGGVSAKLDYEMEQMTDFVSEAAQGMYALLKSNICLADIDICRSIQPGVTVHPSFRKWVSQVLAATRLPSFTILLSLHYLTVRMRQFPSSIEKTDQQPYRLLAVSLILGSKFLDDNTFINRSWSDVSGIKVTELNSLEMQWLALIGFDLHADHQDENGVSLWIRAWKDYESRIKNKANATKLLPINTDVHRQSVLNSASATFQPAHARNTRGTATPLSSSSFHTALSHPYTSADPWNRSESSLGHNFPHARYQPGEFTPQSAHGSSGRFELDATATVGAQQYHQYSLPALSTLTPTYYSPWNHSSWEQQHAWGCRCGCVARSNSHYLTGSSFHPQTVVG